MPSWPGRGAAFFVPLRRAGTLPSTGVRYGPGSAAHRSASAPRCAASGARQGNRVMGTYLLRRLMLMGLTLFGMSVLIFIALRLVPGNIADILVDSAGIVDDAQKLKIEHELGLDRSLVVQYGQWIGGLLQGDLGYAYISERPAIEEIAPRIPVTAKLATLALFFAVAIGVPLGVLSAVRRNTPLDYVLRVLSLSGLSLPSFWLGLLVLLLFVQVFGWIPIYNKPVDNFWKELVLLSIRALVVGFRSSALMMRLTPSSMLKSPISFQKLSPGLL